MNKTNWRDGYVKGEKMPMYQLGIDVDLPLYFQTSVIT